MLKKGMEFFNQHIILADLSHVAGGCVVAIKAAVKMRSSFEMSRVCRAVIVFVVVVAANSPGAFAQEAATPRLQSSTGASQSSAPQGSPSLQPSPAPQASPTPSLERRFFRNVLRDQRAIWTSPLRVRGSDARWLVPLGVATTALIATDRRTAAEVSTGGSLPAVSRVLSYPGSLYAAGGVAAGFYLIGRGTGNTRARETGLLSAEALLDSVIVYSVLKAATPRPRPNFDNGRGHFFGGGNSFPSGHAANAWSVATVIAYEYRERPVVRYGAFAAATAVSLSRFTGRRHFLSDALVGSAIGYGIGRYVYRTHHDPGSDPTNAGTGGRTRSSLLPLIAPQYDLRTRTYGATLVWSF